MSMFKGGLVIGVLLATILISSVFGSTFQKPAPTVFSTKYIGQYLGSHWCTWEYHRDYPFYINFFKADEDMVMRTFPCPHVPNLQQRIGWWKV